jgi:hypothetical protein
MIGYNPSVVNTNLLWCIDAGNPRSYPGSGTTWYDVNTATNGTLTNGPTYTSGTSGYFTFDGVDDYVNMGSSVNLAQNFTLEIWCYITGDVSGLFGQGTYAVSQGLHILWYYPGNRGMIFGMYGNDLDTPGYTLTYNTWHQFCFTYNNSTYLKQFYADGALINSGTGSAWAGSGQFNVGMVYSAPGNTTMKGRIGNAKMYNTVLTASQVSQNFNALRGRYSI